MADKDAVDILHANPRGGNRFLDPFPAYPGINQKVGIVIGDIDGVTAASAEKAGQFYHRCLLTPVSFVYPPQGPSAFLQAFRTLCQYIRC